MMSSASAKTEPVAAPKDRRRPWIVPTCVRASDCGEGAKVPWYELAMQAVEAQCETDLTPRADKPDAQPDQEGLDVWDSVPPMR